MDRSNWSSRISAASVSIAIALPLIAGCAPPRAAEKFNYQSPGAVFISHIPGGAEYVALGDSFSAMGTRSARFTDDLCLRTVTNLGHVIANMVQPATFTDAACSGATLDSMVTADATTPAQIAAVGPNTRLVTLVAAANTLGFPAVTRNCFEQPSLACRDAVAQNLPQSPWWKQVRAQYREVVAQIQRRSPRALVILGGYLPLFSGTIETEDACAVKAGVPPWAVALWQRWFVGLNLLIADVARQQGAQFVAPPADTRSCQPQPLISVVSAADAGTNDAYGYHPTVAGQHAFGDLIARAVTGRSA